MASLIELAFRSGSRMLAPGLASYLERILLDQPWVDPASLPSFRLTTRNGSSGSSGPTSDGSDSTGSRSAWRSAASCRRSHGPTTSGGSVLDAALLEGPQEITLTDTASETARRMWGVRR